MGIPNSKDRDELLEKMHDGFEAEINYLMDKAESELPREDEGDQR